jgi:hypothetical protein
MKQVNSVSAGRYEPIIHSALFSQTGLREPTVFDSVIWQAISSLQIKK